MTTDRLIGKVCFGLIATGLLFFLKGHCFAQSIHIPEHIPKVLNTLPVYFKPLEQALLIDASDGILNSFSLIDAGLIASGATTNYTLSKHKRQFKTLQQHALLSIPYLMQTERMAVEIFNYLHRRVLRRFETRPVTLLDLWSKGRYKCVTASYIYLIIARTYDLPVIIIETPMHAYIQLQISPPLPIELTVPNGGFNFSQTQEQVIQNLLLVGLITPKDLTTHTPKALFEAYRERQRALTPVQVLSVFFYNRALSAFEHYNPAEAFQHALAAYLIHPEDHRYQRLLHDFGLAYATTLHRENQQDARKAILAYLETLKE
ncbi:MAG: hypothetical protein ACO36I_22355 [Candidatus Latescibacterota bacterium]